jgi:hypothetical protein
VVRGSLWVRDANSGVRYCLGQEINHFLVAPVSQHMTYVFSNLITYRIDRAPMYFIFLVCDNVSRVAQSV